MIKELIEEVAACIWKILPAYIANASPLVITRNRKCHPLDFNKKFIDKRPILGSGKTIEGFIAGIIMGGIVGALQTPNNPIRAFTLSLGAMLGDSIGSFIKRRFNIERGKPAPLLDQLMFILVAMLLSYKFETYTLQDIVVIIAITIPLHVVTNKIAYILGIKKVPW
ncbi:MAG: CDP-2,3-bis-(O-geranylgeranyl)-sn-glycerol synthase [Candidatus Verstraetearchaeota archaeon]|jgi:CDP-2,3-bis-(O-geranylgeranyl)-sn-glycerol synthase|nr:CDP-2,3-bis-(O-geranylgeranyl)-sn-glycerol synthase [Candidatus Verstraetearchaeota archaeon]